jgi:hypothetical protein
MKRPILLGLAWLSIASIAVRAAETAPVATGSQTLPFDPDVVSRLSLDGKPRSLAIRQGADVWLGYDLERATLMKAWRAPPGKAGLIKSGFTTRSTGITWFEDPSANGWQWKRGETAVPLSVRYLGCSHRTDHVELRWELRHDGGTLRLFERIRLVDADAISTARVMRDLRVETLAPEEQLLPPEAVLRAWKLSAEIRSADPGSVHSNSADLVLRGGAWHRLILP